MQDTGMRSELNSEVSGGICWNVGDSNCFSQINSMVASSAENGSSNNDGENCCGSTGFYDTERDESGLESHGAVAMALGSNE